MPEAGRSGRILLALGLTLICLSGCRAFLGAGNILEGPQVNLRENSYGAADMLAQQSRGMLRPGTAVRVDALQDAHAPANAQLAGPNPNTIPTGEQPPAGASPVSIPVPAPFGRVVAEQVAGRFVDLGYNVLGGTTAPRAGQAVLTGQYARANGRVLVNLRLIDVGSGRVLGAYDYAVPITREIQDLLARRGYSD